MNDAAKIVIEAVESGIAAYDISKVDVGDRRWQVTLPGSSRPIQALGETVRLLTGGGWISSNWLAARLEKATSALAKRIAKLLQRSWKDRKVTDPEHQEVRVLGSVE